MAPQCVNKCTCFKRTLNPPLGISHHTGDRRWSSHSGRVNIETRIWSCCCCCCCCCYYYCCCLKYTQPVYLQKLQYRSSELALPPPLFNFLFKQTPAVCSVLSHYQKANLSTSTIHVTVSTALSKKNFVLLHSN